ncbi:MAG: hypothetical protein GXY82_00580 [Methanospirillum sp.]|nr:hypothetical protein [Methanospirillum sp.]
MSVFATLDWPRVLTPAGVGAIRSVIERSRFRALFDVMLYSGMRYADLRQVLDEPDRFDEERGTITILTGGKKQRTVVLGDRGREAGMTVPIQHQRTPLAGKPCSPGFCRRR